MTITPRPAASASARAGPGERSRRFQRRLNRVEACRTRQARAGSSPPAGPGDRETDRYALLAQAPQLLEHLDTHSSTPLSSVAEWDLAEAQAGAQQRTTLSELPPQEPRAARSYHLRRVGVDAPAGRVGVAPFQPTVTSPWDAADAARAKRPSRLPPVRENERAASRSAPPVKAASSTPCGIRLLPRQRHHRNRARTSPPAAGRST